MHTRHQHLFKTELQGLRPTQITVGYAEVEQKRGLWSGLGKALGAMTDASYRSSLA